LKDVCTQIAPSCLHHFQKPKIGEEYCALVIVAGMLGHSILILLNTYAHFIPTMQDEAAQPGRKESSLCFAAKYAAQLMDDILTPISFDFKLMS
jgi:hypothetical protein